jgi:hypothetical protein
LREVRARASGTGAKTSEEVREIRLMKWIAIGTAAVVAGPIVLPLLAAGNCDGIDGGCDE